MERVSRQAVSAAVLGIGLHANLWSAFRGADMKTPAARDGYIEELGDRLFGTEKEEPDEGGSYSGIGPSCLARG